MIPDRNDCSPPTLLRRAILAGDLPRTKQLISDVSPSPTSQRCGLCLLHLAVWKRHYSLVRFLIEDLNHSPNILTNLQETSLHLLMTTPVLMPSPCSPEKLSKHSPESPSGSYKSLSPVRGSRLNVGSHRFALSSSLLDDGGLDGDGNGDGDGDGNGDGQDASEESESSGSGSGSGSGRRNGSGSGSGSGSGRRRSGRRRRGRRKKSARGKSGVVDLGGVLLRPYACLGASGTGTDTVGAGSGGSTPNLNLPNLPMTTVFPSPIDTGAAAASASASADSEDSSAPPSPFVFNPVTSDSSPSDSSPSLSDSSPSSSSSSSSSSFQNRLINPETKRLFLYLVSRGADVSLRNSLGLTPLETLKVSAQSQSRSLSTVNAQSASSDIDVDPLSAENPNNYPFFVSRDDILRVESWIEMTADWNAEEKGEGDRIELDWDADIGNPIWALNDVPCEAEKRKREMELLALMPELEDIESESGSFGEVEKQESEEEGEGEGGVAQSQLEPKNEPGKEVSDPAEEEPMIVTPVVSSLPNDDLEDEGEKREIVLLSPLLLPGEEPPTEGVFDETTDDVPDDIPDLVDDDFEEEEGEGKETAVPAVQEVVEEEEGEDDEDEDPMTQLFMANSKLLIRNDELEKEAEELKERQKDLIRKNTLMRESVRDLSDRAKRLAARADTSEAKLQALEQRSDGLLSLEDSIFFGEATAALRSSLRRSGSEDDPLSAEERLQKIYQQFEGAQISAVALLANRTRELMDDSKFEEALRCVDLALKILPESDDFLELRDLVLQKMKEEVTKPEMEEDPDTN